MEDEKKEQLISKGYLSKVKKMTYVMVLPLVIAFLSSFFVKNIKLFNDILIDTWGLFGLITILEIVIVNYSVRE